MVKAVLFLFWDIEQWWHNEKFDFEKGEKNAVGEEKKALVQKGHQREI